MHHLKNGSSAPYRLQCDYSSVGGALFRGEGSKPFYIPLRALLVGGAPNLLVAGKTMSQSFHASASTRLHPSEWTSGAASVAPCNLLFLLGFPYATSVLIKKY